MRMLKMRVHNALQIGGKGLKGHSVSGDNGANSSSADDNVVWFRQEHDGLNGYSELCMQLLEHFLFPLF